jgi:glycolate oxidase FAD binding subunit
VAAGQIDHQPADMAVTVAADVPLSEVQAQLATAGQWLGLDGDPKRPVGWLMQHDSTGPLRLGFGGWRDLMTGVQFTDGRGDLVTVGGMTVKNVAGYDLVKFMVGSHGCFGTPVTVTLRTYRLPEAALVASVEPTSGIVPDLLESAAPPQWMLLMPDGLRVGWLGKEREISSLTPVLGQTMAVERRDLAEDAEERRQALDPGPELVRLYVAPTDLSPLLAELPRNRWAVDPVFGVVWLAVPETFSDVLGALKELGGHATWLGRDGVRVYGVGRAARAVLERLKLHLDPAGRLPGLPFEG